MFVYFLNLHFKVNHYIYLNYERVRYILILNEQKDNIYTTCISCHSVFLQRFFLVKICNKCLNYNNRVSLWQSRPIFLQTITAPTNTYGAWYCGIF